jgi:glycosyltransferase involved in cell wall biosynthesis
VIPAAYKRNHTGAVASGWRDVMNKCFRQYYRLWQQIHVGRIKYLLQRMGIENVILYLWRPDYCWSIGRFSESLTCYHVDDEYSFDPTRDVPIDDNEMILLTQSELVFIHSRTLMAKKGSINPNTYYVPNGVDFDHFRSVAEDQKEEPNDLKRISRPRLGYVGYLKRHLDLPLLLAMARQRREWSIVLVGPVREEHHEIMDDIAQLRAEPNVHFLGYKPYSELPVYIRGFDVCLMNYRKTPYTKYIYPIKLHEYLACGKPVVATPLANLEEFANVLYFAEGEGQWLQAIGRALNEADCDLRAKRLEVARENSWESRVKTIVSVFNNTLERSD